MSEGHIELELRHRATMEESFEARYERFMAVMAEVEPPWGLKGFEIPPVPRMGNELIALARLKPLSSRDCESYIGFPRRAPGYLRDNAQYDDTVFVKRPLAGIDPGPLFADILPRYIEVFEAYKARVSDPAVRLADWDDIVARCQKTGRDADGRDGVYRIHAANYFDRELCQRAFGRTPEAAAKIVEGLVARAEAFRDGILIVCADRILPRDEQQRLGDEVLRRLVGRGPCAWLARALGRGDLG